MKKFIVAACLFFTLVSSASALTAQSIEVSGPVVAVYGSGIITLSATGGGSQNAITFSTPGFESDCVVNNVTGFSAEVIMQKAGTCTIYADQEGDGEYDPAPRVTHEINIRKQTLSVEVTAADKSYDGSTDVSLHVTEIGGSVRSGISLIGTGSFASPDAGDAKQVTVHSVTIEGSEKDNYEVVSIPTGVTASITKRPATPRIIPPNKVYDGTANLVETTVCQIPTLDLNFSLCTYTSASYDNENIGAGKTVTATGISFLNPADEQNFSLTTTTATGIAEITGIPLTIAGTVHDKSYDDTTTATFTPEIVSGVLAGDTVSISGGSAAFPNKIPGVYTVSVSGYTIDGPQSFRYVLGNSTFTDVARIDKRTLSITPTFFDKAYDGNTEAAVQLVTDALPEDDISVHGTSSFNTKHAGSNIPVSIVGITLGGSDAENYTAVTSLSGAASITKRTLTVTPIATDKTYDGTTDATVTFQDDRQDRDDVVVSATAVFSSAEVGANIPLIVSGATLGGLDAGNYTLVMGNGFGTIEKRPLTVSFAVSDKVYDQSAAATITVSTLSGALSGDDVSVTGGSATFADALVGSGKTVTGNSFMLAGADAAQYELTSIQDTTASITAKPLTLTITAQNKQHDGTTTATLGTATLTGVILGDTVAVQNGTLSFADTSVGTDKIVTATGFLLTGTHKDNYSFTIPEIKASITAVPVVSSGGGGGGGGSATLTSCSILAQPQTVAVGGQTKLTFVSTNGGVLVFEFDGKEYASNSSALLTPTTTTTYKATLKGTTASCTNTVVVGGEAGATQGATPLQGLVLGASTFNFSRDLKLRSRLSPDVLELQKKLIERGLLAQDSATGYFGQMTFAAVVRYQQSVGVQATGYVGPATRFALNGSAAPRVLGETKFKFNKNFGIGSRLSPDVTELQKILVKKTLLASDGTTGYFGTLTQAAVTRYQALNGLEPVGSVGPRTREVLNSEK